MKAPWQVRKQNTPERAIILVEKLKSRQTQSMAVSSGFVTTVYPTRAVRKPKSKRANSFRNRNIALGGFSAMIPLACQR